MATTMTDTMYASLGDLAAALRGDLIVPGDPDYDDARAVYNGMIDRRPAVIVRCADVADVIAAVNFGREQGLDTAIRGGGHNGGGLGTVDDGLVIDLSKMHSVHVAPARKRARVEGGATWGDVDHATHAFGLGVPSGTISTTGVGGLTLGGGLGHTTRSFGLTVDHLIEAEVVLADGRVVTASEDENPDLLWALRGGGGNFGVVTSFVFSLVELDTVIAGPILWPLEESGEVLAFWKEYIKTAPEALNAFFAFLTVPPGPPFPEHLHMKKMCGLVCCYTGDPARADEALASLRAIGNPALDLVGPMPYPVLQSMFDALYPPGLQWYWRADYFDEFSDDAIAAHVEQGKTLPTLHSTMHIYPINGKAHAMAPDATAFSYRDANWAQVIVGVSPDPADAGMLRDWAVGYWDALHPYSMGGGYVNFMMDEGQERVQATYRDNYRRLAEIKRKYDPDNFFHVNQNIRPA